ncbi:MAG: [LysW]-aminoadipate/[LysW]-glutamate kinase [Candidatus Bathyarchaeia archaeon]
MTRLVVKIGGALLEGNIPEIVGDLKGIQSRFEVVIVHGGGNRVSRVARKLGKEPRFVVSVSGIRSRYTDRETAHIFEMVMAGSVNKEIVRACQMESVRAVGLSGSDGWTMRARRKGTIKILERGKKMMLKGDYTGKIVNVNPELIELLLQGGYVPVLAPIAMGYEYESLNVDGDRAAAYIAGAVKAEALLLLTDVTGVLFKGKLIERLRGEEIQKMAELVGHGMKRKILASLEALEMGVERVVIASGLVDRPISSALSLKGCTVLEM